MAELRICCSLEFFLGRFLMILHLCCRRDEVERRKWSLDLKRPQVVAAKYATVESVGSCR
jgi:hypothetical protein